MNRRRLHPQFIPVLLLLGLPLPAAAPPALTIAQVQYDGGGDWYANPSGVPNLLSAIWSRTQLPVAAQPTHVRLTDPALWNHPYLYLTGHGNVRFSEEEWPSCGGPAAGRFPARG
jgi:hypothetical protein